MSDAHRVGLIFEFSTDSRGSAFAEALWLLLREYKVDAITFSLKQFEPTWLDEQDAAYRTMCANDDREEGLRAIDDYVKRAQ
jgi:hypothetical protein